MKTKNVVRVNEKGNVLFLILIAVALFAALSYAVTQSTRSGGGSTDREQSILSGASMTQHPTALRTSVIRMILAGTDVGQLQFNAPSDFGNLTTDEQGVFHPLGGGGLFQQAPADVMEGTAQGQWFFNANWDVPQIGVSNTGTSNDLIAFLPGVNRAVCLEVNRELNFVDNISDCDVSADDSEVPTLDTTTDETRIAINADNTYTFPTTDQEDLANSNASCSAFAGHPSGCFYEDTLNEYVFYSVILER